MTGDRAATPDDITRARRAQAGLRNTDQRLERSQ